jgi:hypothetical protein
MAVAHALLRQRLRILIWALVVTLVLPLPSYLPAITFSLLAGQMWNDLAPTSSRRALVVGTLMTTAIGVAGAVAWGARPPLTPISADDRAALAAFRQLPAETTIAIRSGCFWAEDAVGEWAPVLTGHRVTTTVQGLEWVGSTAAARVMRERSSPSADVTYVTTAACR